MRMSSTHIRTWISVKFFTKVMSKLKSAQCLHYTITGSNFDPQRRIFFYCMDVVMNSTEFCKVCANKNIRRITRNLPQPQLSGSQASIQLPCRPQVFIAMAGMPGCRATLA